MLAVLVVADPAPTSGLRAADMLFMPAVAAAIATNTTAAYGLCVTL